MSRILVVDDDPDILELIEFKLSSLGYDVHTRRDGLTGLEAVRELQPELVVLDWMMPGCSGLQVLETLRADPSFAALPVLVVTARSQADDLARTEAAGATAHIVKPFSLKDLAARVAEQVGPA